MNYNEIKNEIDQKMQHMPLCQTQRKENKDQTVECTCYHDKAVQELTDTMIQVVKGNR